MVTVLLRWPVRYCAFIDPGQVKKTRNTKVGAMDIEKARIGSQKSHQIVAYCHILSLLVRGCHGAHISIALSRPRVEGKEFWVFSSDAPWTCRNREVMAISPRNPALRPLLCSCLQSVPHGKGMKVFALLLGEPDIIDTYGHIWTSYTVNCQIIINDLISNIQWYTMSNVQNTI